MSTSTALGTFSDSCIWRILPDAAPQTNLIYLRCRHLVPEKMFARNRVFTSHSETICTTFTVTLFENQFTITHLIIGTFIDIVWLQGGILTVIILLNITNVASRIRFQYSGKRSTVGRFPAMWLNNLVYSTHTTSLSRHWHIIKSSGHGENFRMPPNFQHPQYRSTVMNDSSASPGSPRTGAHPM